MQYHHDRINQVDNHKGMLLFFRKWIHLKKLKAHAGSSTNNKSETSDIHLKRIVKEVEDDDSKVTRGQNLQRGKNHKILHML